MDTRDYEDGWYEHEQHVYVTEAWRALGLEVDSTGLRDLGQEDLIVARLRDLEA